jgi:hypothetical protein
MLCVFYSVSRACHAHEKTSSPERTTLTVDINAVFYKTLMYYARRIVSYARPFRHFPTREVL